jgi:hypothetical protein
LIKIRELTGEILKEEVQLLFRRGAGGVAVHADGPETRGFLDWLPELLGKADDLISQVRTYGEAVREED